MTTSILLSGAEIVAVATPPRSRSPFNQARPIVRSGDGRHVRARLYTADAGAEGPELTAAELESLVAQEQMFGLGAPVTARAGVGIWVLRPNFPQRERALAELAASGVLYAMQRGPENAQVCLVDESLAAASDLRDRWWRAALGQAKGYAAEGRWPAAERAAGVAYAVSPGLEPDVLALLALTHEHNQRGRRAKGLVIMARRSRGAEFAVQVEQALTHFRDELKPAYVSPAQGASGMLDGLRQALSARGRSTTSARTARIAPAHLVPAAA